MAHSHHAFLRRTGATSLPTTAPALVLLLTALGCGSSQAPVAVKPAAPAVSAAGDGAPAPGGEGTGDVVTRDIMRTRLPPGMISMALAYSVYVKEGDKETPVDPHAYTFRVGDKIVVRIKPDDDLYVYIFSEGPTGNLYLLMPAEGEKPRLVEKGVEVSLPDDDTLEFREPAGAEKLLVVATYQPSEQVKLLAREAFRRQGQTTQSEAAKQAEAEAEARAALEPGLETRGPSASLVKKPEKPITHVFPPSEGKPENYAITYTDPAVGKPEMFLNIPLVSRSEASTPAP